VELFIVLEDINETLLYHVCNPSEEQLEIANQANGEYINSNADDYSAAMKVWDSCQSVNHSGNNPAWEGIWSGMKIESGDTIETTDGLFICQTGVV
jgi:hypothetical protein